MSHSGSSSSLSISPSGLIGSILNEASQESQLAMLGGSSNRNSMRLSASFEKRNSLTRSGAGHGRGHSRTGSISLSQSALAGGVVVAALGHLSTKGITTTSRPTSTHFANTTHSHTRGHSRSGSRSLAASRSRPSSFIGNTTIARLEEKSWKDEECDSTQDLFKTPTMDHCRFEALDADATPQQKVPFSMPTTTITMATPTAPGNHDVRRASRHSRKGSVSTRRESMEIMGGLPVQDSRNSRRITSNRWSGLQSASVLFGGAPDLVTFERKREADEEESEEDKGGDRLTALEKLEGKRQRDSIQSSVQLPTFDDVHGEEAMDKRASLHLLEANVQTTSAERSPVTIVAPAPAAAARPPVMTETGNDLGILMEEEEEEEESSILSPIKERGNIDFVAEEESRKRKEAEQEVIKRNRRGSLTPKPLKLKSRPASLFVAPRSSGLSASQSFPELCMAEEEKEEEEEEEEKVAETVTTSDSLPAQQPIPTTWNFASTRQDIQPAQKLQGLSSRPLALSPPSKEIKRSWRSSMPVAIHASPSNTSTLQSTQLATTTNGSSRQGIRALQLGGGNLSTSSTASSLVRQHRNHTDSTSSMTSMTSTSSAALSKRGSLLYNASPIASFVSREDVSPMAKRRGSLLYKTSPLDAASSAELSTSATASPSSQKTNMSFSSTSSTGGGGGGVPMSLFEELKSKHQRDVGLLDDARSKIARLENEIMAESEKKIHELAEMERWSAEEKRLLGQRIEYLEASIAEIIQVREAKEQSLEEDKRLAIDQMMEIKANFEDVEAERDMLRDDVEGWRTRCSDLEKSLRVERQANEELKRLRQASKQRIKELVAKLQENDIAVDRNSVDEDDVSSELLTTLRSPNMGSSSPLLSSTQREESASPIHADIPPPQAVQLLRDMRQQIFNLAGSLEHERRQHLLARQEAEDSRAEMIRLRDSLHDEVTDNTTLTTMDSHLFTPEKHEGQESLPTTSTPPQMSNSSGSPVKPTKTKRNHVFAYDSSMESGYGSNSMCSGSVTTNQTSQDEDEINAHTKDDEAFIARVQADLVGLGMGSLGTLPEEEEAALEQQDQSTERLNEQEVEMRNHDFVDIESGRRASDVESIAPPTPALDHTNRYQEEVIPLPPTSLMKEQTSLRSSASSSMESHGPPSPSAPNTVSSQGASTNEYNDDVYDASYDENKTKSRETRPEFVREWSFEQATAAIRSKKILSQRQPLVVTSVLRKKNRPISVEDFFGIMHLDESQKLPPLPTPDEALEMPPLFIEEAPYSAARQMGYGNQPRFPSQIRAPVPRSSALYNRSLSDRSSTSSRNSASSYNRQMNQDHYSGVDQSNLSAASAAAGGMFSRVVSLTSAFSGLGGYLIGTSTSPGPANKTYTNDDYDDRHSSTTWAVTRREEEMA